MTAKAQFANSSVAAHFVSFYNEINIGADGWAMIAPFGDHPSNALIPDGNGKMKKQQAIQRIDKAGAEAMVAQFHNEHKGVRKFLSGCNIYVGHPDVPGLEKFYPDHEAKGIIADVEVRNDGLYGMPVFTNEGSDLVEEKKLRAFSGNIGESEPDGDLNGLPVYRPTKLFSVGLTNTPHLPVHFFNADETLAEMSNDCLPQTQITTFANVAQRSGAISAAVTEEMKNGRSYGAAFNAVERQSPHLFAGMKQVEIIMPHRRKPITL